MLNYFLKRIGLGILSLFLILVFTYFLVGLSTKSPFDPIKFPNAAELAQQKGFNDPIVERFFRYLKGIFSGDFGEIYNTDVTNGLSSISEVFFSPLKYTIAFTLPAFFISLVLALTLGFLSGYKSGSTIDFIINIFAIFFVAVPGFILASLFLILAPTLNLPSLFQNWENNDLSLSLKSMILPILTLVLANLSTLTFFVRNEVISILTSNYVRTARAKGLSEFSIFRKYVFRNSSIPIISILLPNLLGLLAGSFIIEQFFGIPGTSSVIIQAYENNEVNIVMFNTLFFAFLGILVQVVVDMSYVLIDPRIKYSSATQSYWIERLTKFFYRKRAFKKMQQDSSEEMDKR